MRLKQLRAVENLSKTQCTSAGPEMCSDESNGGDRPHPPTHHRSKYASNINKDNNQASNKNFLLSKTRTHRRQQSIATRTLS
jgi:hypothetical protein